MKKDHREDTVGPWAEEKLSKLEAYLRYYCTALSKKNFTLVYVDGFAGSPVTSIRQQAVAGGNSDFWAEEDSAAQTQFVLGSPIRALSLTPGFDKHYFFDLDARRVASLDALKADFPGKWVHVEVGEANERIRKLVTRVQREPLVKGVAFLDPYGANLEWQTVEALAQTRKFEVIINLPVHMALNRLLMKDIDRRPDWEEMVDRCFGTTEWRGLAYPETTNLFGETHVQKAGGVPEMLLQLYMKRLRSVFPEVATPRLIRNTKNSPLYYLIWAGPHKRGLTGAEYVLGHGEKLAKKNR